MKHLFLILLFGFFLVSCDNELDISEDWKNIPVVYGIIDPSDTAHYFRIEKAFYDPDIDAYTIAAIADSIYYKVADAYLEDPKTKQRFSLQRVDGNLEGYIRNEGVFAQSPNYLYKILDSELKSGLKSSLDFKLIINQGKDTISSNTLIVKDFKFTNPKPGEVQRLDLNYQNKISIRWSYAENAHFYDVGIRINYRERNLQESTTWKNKSIEWTAERYVTTNNIMVQGQDFFVNIGSLIEEDPFVEREFRNMEFIIAGFGKEIFDYISIYGANLGITGSQEIPLYSNIVGGIGIFSAKKTIEIGDLLLVESSQDSLISGIYTNKLNFK